MCVVGVGGVGEEEREGGARGQEDREWERRDAGE